MYQTDMLDTCLRKYFFFYFCPHFFKTRSFKSVVTLPSLYPLLNVPIHAHKKGPFLITSYETDILGTISAIS